MKHLSKQRVPLVNSISYFLCTFALASLIPSICAQRPNKTPASGNGQGVAVAPGVWHLDGAVHMIGLSGIKDNEKGSLSISPTALDFAFPDGQILVKRKEIQSISVGVVSIETGGTAVL